MRRGESGISLLLGIDKPEGLTSHDVVARVRRALGERRVGHAGTLDPAAAGVLVVGVGSATRLLGLATQERKRYLARISFGSETTTDDAEGEVVERAPVPAELGEEAVARAALSALVGELDQVPPAFSAVHVDGRRAYDLARQGEGVELAARRVRVFSADLVAVEAGTAGTLWTCVLDVSKGTYVRSIARDLGRSLGTRAHLDALRRLSAGAVGLSDCVSLERLSELGPARVREAALDPVAVLGLPVRRLAGKERSDAASGRRLPSGGLAAGTRCALVADGLLLGVWESDGAWLRSVTNVPAGVGGVRS